MDASPGVDLLLAIGAEQPDLLLTGRTLRDQGVMLTGLLEAGRPVRWCFVAVIGPQGPA
ncbi:hypothetical protein ACIOHB_36380 [Streptomyces microflavus]|uniref:hypothetical protein n=1 Tax=Streptomyces microflavus TaxID=1919 RepID=UPI0038114A57